MMLPRLHLQLTSSWVQRVRLGQWGLSLLTVAAAGIAVWAWWASLAVTEEAHRYEEATERVQRSAQKLVADSKKIGLELSDKQTGILEREASFANQLLEKRAFSWTRFLGDLENALPPRISIGSVALNFKDSTITLNGAARTFKDLTAFVDGLERHPAFSNVVLSNHRIKEPKEDERKHGTKPEPGIPTVEFTLTVNYKLEA
jgi:Tfp pilus assembly protein PilN